LTETRVQAPHTAGERVNKGMPCYRQMREVLLWTVG
jgi:hypothetical protein